eukprot:8129175-Pyramimonas_sp.AAC.2
MQNNVREVRVFHCAAGELLAHVASVGNLQDVLDERCFFCHAWEPLFIMRNVHSWECKQREAATAHCAMQPCFARPGGPGVLQGMYNRGNASRETERGRDCTLRHASFWHHVLGTLCITRDGHSWKCKQRERPRLHAAPCIGAQTLLNNALACARVQRMSQPRGRPAVAPRMSRAVALAVVLRRSRVPRGLPALVPHLTCGCPVVHRGWPEVAGARPAG